MADVNLARIPDDWLIDASFKQIDYAVLSPSGAPSIRVDKPQPGDVQQETREVNCKNDWTIGRGKAGDHVIFKCWAKTEPYSMKYPWDGARIGIDYEAVVHRRDTGETKFEQLDTLYSEYQLIGDVWYSYNPRTNYPIVPISTFQAPWGTFSWIQLVFDFIVPSYTYTADFYGHSIDPVQTQASSIWLDVREVADEASAWFGDAEWFINPSGVTKHRVNLASSPFNVQFQQPSGLAPFTVEVDDGGQLIEQVPNAVNL